MVHAICSVPAAPPLIANARCAMKVAAKGDKLVELAIQSIPASSLSGIPTMRQVRVKVVQSSHTRPESAMTSS